MYNNASSVLRRLYRACFAHISEESSRPRAKIIGETNTMLPVIQTPNNINNVRCHACSLCQVSVLSRLCVAYLNNNAIRHSKMHLMNVKTNCAVSLASCTCVRNCRYDFVCSVYRVRIQSQMCILIRFSAH